MTNELNPVYLKFRERALAWRDPEAPMGSPSGIIMETGVPEGVVSLVVMSDGTASLFYSGGGAILGAGIHPGPARAARELAMAAAHFASQMQPALDLDMPKAGMVSLYVLIDGIIRGASGKERDFGENRMPLSPLFHAAHHVIGEIRRLPPPEQAGKP
jgi:hypothetical protein